MTTNSGYLRMFTHFKIQRIYTKTLILFVIGIVGLLLGACQGTEKKVYHIGMLSGLNTLNDIADGFKAKMAELGYIEGENVIYDFQSPTVADPALYQSALEKFVSDKVDLIFVFPTEAALMAKTITADSNIPVVFSFAFTDGVGLVENLTHPGANMTGVSYPTTDIVTRRLEILLEIAPDAKRIWVPYYKDYLSVPSQLAAIQPLAEELGLTIIEFPTDSVQEFQDELARRASSEDPGIDAILMLAEPLTISPDFFIPLAKFAEEKHLVLGGNALTFDNYSAVFGLSPVPYVAGQEAALQVQKVLQGIPPGDIPVAFSESALTINYGFAQALGVTIPEGLLNQADEVIR